MALIYLFCASLFITLWVVKFVRNFERLEKIKVGGAILFITLMALIMFGGVFVAKEVQKIHEKIITPENAIYFHSVDLKGLIFTVVMFNGVFVSAGIISILFGQFKAFKKAIKAGLLFFISSLVPITFAIQDYSYATTDIYYEAGHVHKFEDLVSIEYRLDAKLTSFNPSTYVEMVWKDQSKSIITYTTSLDEFKKMNEFNFKLKEIIEQKNKTIIEKVGVSQLYVPNSANINEIKNHIEGETQTNKDKNNTVIQTKTIFDDEILMALKNKGVQTEEIGNEIFLLNQTKMDPQLEKLFEKKGFNIEFEMDKYAIEKKLSFKPEPQEVIFTYQSFGISVTEIKNMTEKDTKTWDDFGSLFKVDSERIKNSNEQFKKVIKRKGN